MRIIVVGATGTIGQAVVKELAPRHEIVHVAFKGGDVQVDITSSDSIKKMYQKVGTFDAVVSTTGTAKFGHFPDLTEEDFYVGIRNKLMGQINLVLIGQKLVNDGGSFTLTSGTLSHDPIVGGSAVSMVNAALEGFVVGAAIEMPRAVRINVVSPAVVQESMDKMGAFFRGHEAVPASRVALAFSKSVEGRLNGQVFRVL